MRAAHKLLFELCMALALTCFFGYMLVTGPACASAPANTVTPVKDFSYAVVNGHRFEGVSGFRIEESGNLILWNRDPNTDTPQDFMSFNGCCWDSVRVVHP